MYDLDYDKIDIERLRSDLADEFGAATYSGFPVAMVDIFDLDNATDEEVIGKALNMGYDLSDNRSYTRSTG